MEIGSKESLKIDSTLFLKLGKYFASVLLRYILLNVGSSTSAMQLTNSKTHD